MKSVSFRRSRCALPVALFLLVSVGATVLPAQTPPPTTPSAPPTTKAPTGGELARYDTFLDTHPVIADELIKHPGLADNADFLKNHPAYATYVAEHPGIAAQLKAHPRYFVHRAIRRDAKTPITPGEVKRLDAFLDKHPEVEQQLVANPGLLNDPKFIEQHPDLHVFLKRHPGVDGAAEAKPDRLMQREEKRDAKERKP
jgi:hypothetical protein